MRLFLDTCPTGVSSMSRCYYYVGLDEKICPMFLSSVSGCSLAFFSFVVPITEMDRAVLSETYNLLKF